MRFVNKAVMAGAVALGLVLSSLPAQAVGLDFEIKFTGLDLVYEGAYQELHDSRDYAGGNGLAGQSDDLTSMELWVDGSLYQTLNNNIFADVSLQGITLPIGGTQTYSAVNGGTFGFDVLTKPGADGRGLGLGVIDVTIDYQLAALNDKLEFVLGLGNASLSFQDLPFDVLDTEPIIFKFLSLDVTGLKTDGVNITDFNATGIGSISGKIAEGSLRPGGGPSVPEPSTLLASCLIGLLGLGYCSRQRR
jgi:hypothetical protein